MRMLSPSAATKFVVWWSIVVWSWSLLIYDEVQSSSYCLGSLCEWFSNLLDFSVVWMLLSLAVIIGIRCWLLHELYPSPFFPFFNYQVHNMFHHGDDVSIYRRRPWKIVPVPMYDKGYLLATFRYYVKKHWHGGRCSCGLRCWSGSSTSSTSWTASAANNPFSDSPLFLLCGSSAWHVPERSRYLSCSWF